MVLFDSNIIIYLGNSTLARKKVDGIDVCYASITAIETLGFTKISVQEQHIIKALLAEYQPIDLSLFIVERAIVLRQQKSMSLGDAIIAATAIENDCILWTANTDDFTGIENLQIYNPIA